MEISSSNLDQAVQSLNLLEEILLDFINLLLIVHLILIYLALLILLQQLHLCISLLYSLVLDDDRN